MDKFSDTTLFRARQALYLNYVVQCVAEKSKYGYIPFDAWDGTESSYIIYDNQTAVYHDADGFTFYPIVKTGYVGNNNRRIIDTYNDLHLFAVIPDNQDFDAFCIMDEILIENGHWQFEHAPMIESGCNTDE